MSREYEQRIECPDDLPEPFIDDSGERADNYRDSHPGLVCVYGAGRMTDEQVRAEMSRIMGIRLTLRQALS